MRRRKAPVREIMADPIYNSKVITKFVNAIMVDGKKSTAEKIMYGAIANLDNRGEDKGIDLFEKAIENVFPMLYYWHVLIICFFLVFQIGYVIYTKAKTKLAIQIYDLF